MNVLAVMAKAPRRGTVKTRLHGMLGNERATELYCALLEDVVRRVRTWAEGAADRSFVLCFSPDGSEGEFASVGISDDDLRLAQRGNDLGARIRNCLSDLLARGADAVVVVGADSPTLPESILAEAFRRLEGGDDLVLGPTDDGGYYLIGCRRLYESIFAGVAWSTERVFGQTLEAARSQGLTVGILDRWYDVDEPADLDRLKVDLARDPSHAPRTAEVLSRFGLHHEA